MITDQQFAQLCAVLRHEDEALLADHLNIKYPGDGIEAVTVLVGFCGRAMSVLEEGALWVPALPYQQVGLYHATICAANGDFEMARDIVLVVMGADDQVQADETNTLTGVARSLCFLMDDMPHRPRDGGRSE